MVLKLDGQIKNRPSPPSVASFWKMCPIQEYFQFRQVCRWTQIFTFCVLISTVLEKYGYFNPLMIYQAAQLVEIMFEICFFAIKFITIEIKWET